MERLGFGLHWQMIRPFFSHFKVRFFFSRTFQCIKCCSGCHGGLWQADFFWCNWHRTALQIPCKSCIFSNNGQNAIGDSMPVLLLWERIH